MEIRWVRQALASLDQIGEFIARDDPLAAERVVEQIRVAVEQLRQFPKMGRIGRVSGTRELVIGGTPYIIPYRVRGDAIEVLRVFHSAREWPARF